MKTCPKHNCKLLRTSTRYGLRYDCPVFGCDIMCWGGTTSTPADQATRTARREAHALFDPLWKGKAAVMSRNEAYRLLQELTGKPVATAHIGMLNRAGCVALIDKLNAQPVKARMKP